MLGQGCQRLLPYCVATVIAALLAFATSAALADPPPPGSSWTETYIDEPDGTQLHADVLRPSNLAPGTKTPVILSIGPYFNHSGQVGPAAPAEGVPYTPAGDAGPSSRFYDFVEGAHLMERGYTYVMVDLRGFGGSSGCLDWVGPGEQNDVKTAVEWAASQPWSTGKVGMYGKSYDGVTGLVAEALHPTGLAAVVSQEPVYDLYRYLYMNRVRFENSLATPALYDAIAGHSGHER
jgi:putative CocE/NonD family hydrolase